MSNGNGFRDCVQTLRQPNINSNDNSSCPSPHTTCNEVTAVVNDSRIQVEAAVNDTSLHPCTNYNGDSSLVAGYDGLFVTSSSTSFKARHGAMTSELNATET